MCGVGVRFAPKQCAARCVAVALFWCIDATVYRSSASEVVGGARVEQGCSIARACVHQDRPMGGAQRDLWLAWSVLEAVGHNQFNHTASRRNVS